MSKLHVTSISRFLHLRPNRVLLNVSFSVALFPLFGPQEACESLEMQQMASAQVNKRCISTAGGRNGDGRDERWPLELVGTRKDDGGCIGEQLKGALPGGLDGREDAAILGFDFLMMIMLLAMIYSGITAIQDSSHLLNN